MNVFLGEARISHLLGIGRSVFADAMSLNEDHGLQQQVGLSRFTLNVVDGRAVFYVSIKTKNHWVPLLVGELLSPLLIMRISFSASPVIVSSHFQHCCA